MKKILLFIAGLMLAMSASAQVYLRGNGDWNSLDRQFTDNGDGTYTLEQAITLKSDFKVASEDWNTVNFGSAGEEAKIGTIAVAAGSNDNIKVSSSINATKLILDTNASTLTIEGADGGAVTYSSWTICGVGELVGDAWEPASTANVMTESNGVYTLTKEGVSLSASFITDADKESATPGYGYKVTADAQWGIKEYPAQGNQFLTVDADGVYNVTFTFNPSTGELSASATLVGEGGDQGGDQGGDDPIDTPTSADYYLIGYINGANYGCEEDYENMGDYKFVNGALTATFSADSYVFIKTEGNGKWFLFESYCQETTGVLAENKSEKMFVPAGTVNFTLVENGDGTLTLSYTTGETTDLEDVDAEDAVVAAYDLIGRPVAIDAPGYVILQYASGKAAKVYNN